MRYWNEKIKWTDRITNKELLKRVSKKNCIEYDHEKEKELDRKKIQMHAANKLATNKLANV